jgi:hypothetical protein
MRKHHNKLYYGKYRHKTVFRVPGSLMFFPTTSDYLMTIKEKYPDYKDMHTLADFIMANRTKMKFRFQDRKSIFYSDQEMAQRLITQFWDFWAGSETVDPKFSKLDANTVGCSRLPHGKYQYQVYLKKDAQEMVQGSEIETLANFLESNKENCLVTNRDVKRFFAGNSPYFIGGYFYVTEEKFLTPIYMMAQKAIDKVIQFRKVENGSNKETTR